MTTSTTTEAGFFIYGIRLRRECEYRYVGITTKSIPHRLSQHLKVARENRKTPLYDWLRKQDKGAVVAEELQVVWNLDDLGQAEYDLGQAEIDWIAYLKRDGDRLLNVSEGGLGPTGVVWTEEQREAARIRSTGRPGLSRFGEANPFYGRSHSEEQRLKWTTDRKGMNSGVDNPNFGKFGEDHPRFGHSMTREARRALSEARMGESNPNFGKKVSAETRAKLSAVQKGRPKPSSRRNAHTRYHTNKGILKPDCKYCVEDTNAVRSAEESEAQP